MDDWAKQRLAELQTIAPPKRKRAAPSVMLSLSWAAKAAIATNCPKAMVWVWLVYRAWQRGTERLLCPMAHWLNTASAGRLKAWHYDSWRRPD
jgi:hypothetical protein